MSAPAKRPLIARHRELQREHSEMQAILSKVYWTLRDYQSGHTVGAELCALIDTIEKHDAARAGVARNLR